MTFSLFDAGGYFLFSGVGNIGDWAAVVTGWQPAWAWRVGLAALGIVTYFFSFVPLSLCELRACGARDSSRLEALGDHSATVAKQESSSLLGYAHRARYSLTGSLRFRRHNLYPPMRFGVWRIGPVESDTTLEAGPESSSEVRLRKFVLRSAACAPTSSKPV